MGVFWINVKFEVFCDASSFSVFAGFHLYYHSWYSKTN